MFNEDPLPFLIESRALEGERRSTYWCMLAVLYFLSFLVFSFFLFFFLFFLGVYLFCCNSLIEVAIIVLFVIVIPPYAR